MTPERRAERRTRLDGSEASTALERVMARIDDADLLTT
jgi:hypothetical protein